MPQDPTNLIWIDLEMTGLEPQTDRIIEAAIIITDQNLNVVEEGPVLAVHQENSILGAMDDWNQKHHGESGLIDRVRSSELDENAVEEGLIEFMSRHVPQNASPMCGNSICQDRRFLARWMPGLEAYFHYRNLDVSTLKELARRWAPEVAAGHVKNTTHQALQDIRDSIEELRYYREHVLKI